MHLPTDDFPFVKLLIYRKNCFKSCLQLEFLRSGIIKTVFGRPGDTTPDDNEILSALIKFSDQLTDLKKCNKVWQTSTTKD